MNTTKKNAQKHSNDKEKIETLYADFLYNYKITQDYTTAFEDIENLQYIADSKDVIETKALAYNYIQKAKELAAFEQNEVVNDCYTAISLAEKLSESNKSRSKVLIDCYCSLLYYYYALYDDFDKINDIIHKIYDESLKANDINNQCLALNKLSALYIDKARVNDDMSLIDSAKTVIDRAEQIADIFGISQDYVRTKKARLKKKLNLSYEENLSDLVNDYDEKES